MDMSKTKKSHATNTEKKRILILLLNLYEITKEKYYADMFMKWHIDERMRSTEFLSDYLIARGRTQSNEF